MSIHCALGCDFCRPRDTGPTESEVLLGRVLTLISTPSHPSDFRAELRAIEGETPPRVLVQAVWDLLASCGRRVLEQRDGVWRLRLPGGGSP